jgi:hypothetical protein
MASSDNNRYVAKYPMPEGGLIKTGGELLSQQEWDERVEKYPTSYGAVVEYLLRKRKRDLEFEQKAGNQHPAKRLQEERCVDKEEILEMCKSDEDTQSSS